MSQAQVEWHAEDYGLEPLPQAIVDSHGLPMDVSGSTWRFNDPSHSVSFAFARCGISNPWLDYSLKRHLISCLRRVSPIESYNTIRLNVLHMARAATWAKLAAAQSAHEHEESLTRVMSETLELLRAREIHHNFHRLRAWYAWCTDFLPDIGFLPEEAYKWSLVRVPGNEKGVAVRTSDPNGGPLNDAELILLRRALMSDTSKEPLHIQQRAAIWLALVFGRNPANFCLLRLGDFRQLDPDVPEVLVLMIPRIKKRALPRTLFKEEAVEASLARVIEELIADGPHCTVGEPGQRPLFVRGIPREHMVGTAMEQWAWHMSSGDFTALIQSAAERYQLVSPRTDEPLYLTTRRLRYTFATNRVREGISARDLADALDHTDLQHVRVYFDARSSVVERLDRAAAMQIAPKLNLFRGRPVTNAEAANQGRGPAKRIRIIPELIGPEHHVRDLGECGKQEFCNLFPPYSCYPCDKFEPFKDSLDMHELTFDFLIERTERLRSDPLESTRIAVQLDEVIYACAQLILDLRTNAGNDNVH